jgi:hypothetical protein
LVSVPGEGGWRGTKGWLRGKLEWLPAQAVIRAAVVEVELEALADYQALVFIDRDVATIEESMEIGAQRDAIAGAVRPAVSERPDVGGIQDRQRVLLRHCTGTIIRVENLHPEDPLADSWHVGGWRAVPWSLVRRLVIFIATRHHPAPA